MSHGTSRIIKKSYLEPELKSVFLTAPFFKEKPSPGIGSATNYFKWNEPKTDIEYSIISLLNKENIEYSGKYIEYWFQHQVKGQSLLPHCDYNHIVRINDRGRGGSWLHEADKDLIMSPVTIACYLQVGNTIGGELCISEKDWFGYENPFRVTTEDIKQYPYEQYMPRDNDILYFEGSKYFHWINPVIEGERKSMMINFWPEDMEI